MCCKSIKSTRGSEIVPNRSKGRKFCIFFGVFTPDQSRVLLHWLIRFVLFTVTYPEMALRVLQNIVGKVIDRNPEVLKAKMGYRKLGKDDSSRCSNETESVFDAAVRGNQF